MQKWEYLQLAYDMGGTAIDNFGRVWHGKRVKAQTGLERTWLGHKEVWAEVIFAAAFGDLGADGWELAGIVPGSAGYSAVQAEVIGSGWPRSRSLMIFKRPKPE